MIKYKLIEYINGIKRREKVVSNRELRLYFQRLGDSRNNERNLIYHNGLKSHYIQIERVQNEPK